MDDSIHGTWKLVSAPSGDLTYMPEGRMSAILTQEGRPKIADLSKAGDREPAELFNTMIAYAGTFSRNVRLDGNQLYITSDPQPAGIDGRPVVAELQWERLR